MRTYATIDRRLEMSLLSKTMKEDQEDLMTIEQRLDTLERRVSRYRSATMVMALLLVAGVTMGQTTRDATFGEVTCNTLTVVKGFRPVAQLEGWEGGGGALFIRNAAGTITTSIGQNNAGDGLLSTHSSQGKKLVTLGATTGGNAYLSTYSSQGKELVRLWSTTGGNGSLSTYSSQGKELVYLGATDGGNGGYFGLSNKTGEEIVQLKADEYGNGVVGAYNRKGMGRTLKPGL